MKATAPTPAAKPTVLWARLFRAGVFFAMACVVLLNLDRAVKTDLRASLFVAGALGFLSMVPGVILPRLRSLTVGTLPLLLYAVFRLSGQLPAEPTGVTAVLGSYLGQLRRGVVAYMDDVYPLTVEGVPDLELVVLTFVALAVAASAYVAVVLDHPLAGSAGLFVLLAGALAVDLGHTDRWGIILFAILFALLLSTTRPTPSGLRGVRSVAAALGWGGAGVALAAALLLVAPGIAAPAALRWTTWGSGTGPNERLVFNWRQNYPRLLDPGNRFPLMTVDSDLPYYWRANTLEVFTGDSWLATGAFLTSLGESTEERLFPPAETAPLGTRTRQRFDVTALYTSFLFAGGQPQSLDLPLPVEVSVSDSGAFRTWRSLGPRFSYSVVGFVPRVRPADVAGAGRGYPVGDDFGRRYLNLPLPTVAEMAALQGEPDQSGEAPAATSRLREEFEGVYELNEEIVGAADDPYEIALRIERFLRSRYAYALDPPRGILRSPYASFLLQTKKGFCQHFAGSMVLLLRLNGVPSRVAVGFLPGEAIGDRTYLVTTNEAHSWVEVYFPGFGWQPFEPTPGNALPIPGVSSTTPGFTDPFAERNRGGRDATGGGAGTAGLPPEEADFAPGAGGGDAPVSAHGGGWWAAAACVAALLLLPGGRRGAEILIMGRRKGVARLLAEIRALKRDVRAFGIAVDESLTLDELAGKVYRRAGFELAGEVERVQEVLFGGSPAAAEAAAGLGAARPRLRRALRRRVGWWRALLAWYRVPSLTRPSAKRGGAYAAEGE